MKIYLHDRDSVIIESTKHKLKINSNHSGELEAEPKNKEAIIFSDKLFEQRLNEVVADSVKSGWEEKRFDEMKKFLTEYTEKAAKAMNVDRNKLFELMLEKCQYSPINYFQSGNFYKFKDANELNQKIDELHTQIRDLKKEHEKQIIELQRNATKTLNIDVEKVEVNGRTYLDCGIRVNCPHCDRWQEIKDMDNWYPGQEYEGNHECEGCGKVFSVKSDGQP